MKKIKIASMVLFIVSVLVFGAFTIYRKITSDNEAPVITCDSEELVLSVSASEEELLADVKALDNKDGDISDAVVIEKMTAFTEENTRMIGYAVIDEAGNVGRLERKLVYTDYEEPKFQISHMMRFPTGKTINLLEGVQALSSLDGDLTDSIKYSLETTIDLTNPGVHQVEYRVMDSAGNIIYLPIEIEIYNKSEERITVTLSDYLVYVPLNGTFDPQRYYQGASDEGELTVESGVDVKKEGVYYVDYTVKGTGNSGKSRLIVVVTGS